MPERDKQKTPLHLSETVQADRSVWASLLLLLCRLWTLPLKHRSYAKEAFAPFGLSFQPSYNANATLSVRGNCSPAYLRVRPVRPGASDTEDVRLFRARSQTKNTEESLGLEARVTVATLESESESTAAGECEVQQCDLLGAREKERLS